MAAPLTSPKNDYPLVSIIIVNYNGSGYLQKLFDSLMKQSLTDFEVIVVDNASVDGSLDLLNQISDSHPSLRIRVIPNTENVGFCIGNNQGLKIAKGTYIVLLNNDTYVDSLWLEELVKRAQSNDQPAAVVSRIVDNNFTTSSYGSYFDIYGSSLARETSTDSDFFYGVGASLLVPRGLFLRVGGLDSAFFMYKDDPDLCWRLRLLNRKVACAQRSICYHLKASKGLVDSNLEMPVWEFCCAHTKNRFRMLLKNYSYYSLIKRLPISISVVQLRALFLSFRNRTPKYLTGFIQGLFWNLGKLRGTLIERYKIQNTREVGDKFIEKYLLPYSVEVWGLKLLLCQALFKDKSTTTLIVEK